MNTSIETVFNLLGIIAVVSVWYVVIRPAISGLFQQSMFELRDDMFDYMAAGQVSPQDPAYRSLRNAMNGMIRIADRMDLLAFFLALVRFAHEGADKKGNSLTESLECLSPDVRRELESFQRRMVTQFFVFILLRSIVLVSVLLSVILVWTFYKKLDPKLLGSAIISLVTHDQAETSQCAPSLT